MTQPTLGDGPIEQAYRDKMNELAALLDDYFNGPSLQGLPKRKKQTGFVLLVFPFDEVSGQGRCNYISNAERRDVVVMLKEQLRRFEGQPEMKGRA